MSATERNKSIGKVMKKFPKSIATDAIITPHLITLHYTTSQTHPSKLSRVCMYLRLSMQEMPG